MSCLLSGGGGGCSITLHAKSTTLTSMKMNIVLSCYVFSLFFNLSVSPRPILVFSLALRLRSDPSSHVVELIDAGVERSLDYQMCVYAYLAYLCVSVCLHPAAISTIPSVLCHGGRRQLMRACVLIRYLATLTVPPVAPGNHCCCL